MYSRDVMVKKSLKMPFFSVVTKILTPGYTLNLLGRTFLLHLYYACNHRDCEYIVQIAIADDNKGVFVKFRKKSSKKIQVFYRKKLI